MTPPTSALELTRELIGFETVNPPGNEKLCAQYLGRIRDEAGFSVTYHDFLKIALA